MSEGTNKGWQHSYILAILTSRPHGQREGTMLLETSENQIYQGKPLGKNCGFRRKSIIGITVTMQGQSRKINTPTSPSLYPLISYRVFHWPNPTGSKSAGDTEWFNSQRLTFWATVKQGWTLRGRGKHGIIRKRLFMIVFYVKLKICQLCNFPIIKYLLNNYYVKECFFFLILCGCPFIFSLFSIC